MSPCIDLYMNFHGIDLRGYSDTGNKRERVREKTNFSRLSWVDVMILLTKKENVGDHICEGK